MTKVPAERVLIHLWAFFSFIIIDFDIRNFCKHHYPGWTYNIYFWMKLLALFTLLMVNGSPPISSESTMDISLSTMKPESFNMVA